MVEKRDSGNSHQGCHVYFKTCTPDLVVGQNTPTHRVSFYHMLSPNLHYLRQLLVPNLLLS